MAYENVVAVFKSLDDARAASSDLQTAGIGVNDINLHSSEEPASSSSSGKGLWETLLGDKTTGTISGVYDACVAKGWVVLSVTSLLEKADQVAAILASHSPSELEASPETYGSSDDAPSEKVERHIIRRFASKPNPETN